MPSQAEGFAVAIRDAIKAQSAWTQPDGLAQWCRAHGLAVAWPRVSGEANDGK